MYCNFDEQEFEPLEPLMDLLRKISKDRVKTLNIKRYNEMMHTVEGLEQMFEENKSEYKTVIDLFEMFDSACVRFELDDLTVKDTIRFAELVKYSDNYEIYPRTDGKITFGLVFNSVLKVI